jgi:hypothetical protein
MQRINPYKIRVLVSGDDVDEPIEMERTSSFIGKRVFALKFSAEVEGVRGNVFVEGVIEDEPTAG